MRNSVLIGFSGVAIITIIVAVCVIIFGPKAKEYPMATVVIEVDHMNDEIICLDFNGNEWSFSETEDWKVGDIATMVMNDKGTTSIYDDEIVSIRYNGWLNGSWGWDGQQEIISIENN